MLTNTQGSADEYVFTGETFDATVSPVLSIAPLPLDAALADAAISERYFGKPNQRVLRFEQIVKEGERL